MNYSKALKSLLIKAKNLNPTALIDGVTNFNNPSEEIEELSKIRTQTCVTCPYFVDEEIKMLQISDSLQPQLSGKKCGECGCILSYKTRQLIDKCSKWVD
ncbi:hypothetical protein [uncultured Empedobacter sp.]|uniref:hypothetical protein n=1 Tax=uncultured Empedobacter sp. TaxID=410844 RepID=UPI0025E3BC9A|nr:hypothetical protein [uncultured Empedobacter sp.]